MTTWRCPTCQDEVEALATAVGHRCPRLRLRWVDFRPVSAQATDVGKRA